MKNKLRFAAKELYDLRYSKQSKAPYADEYYWYNLGVALYGEDSAKVFKPDKGEGGHFMSLPKWKKAVKVEEK